MIRTRRILLVVLPIGVGASLMYAAGGLLTLGSVMAVSLSVPLLVLGFLCGAFGIAGIKEIGKTTRHDSASPTETNASTAADERHPGDS